MPTANGDYYGHGTPVYDDYDTASRSSNQSGPMPWQQQTNGAHMNGVHHHHDSTQPSAIDQHSHRAMTNGHTNMLHQDDIGRHMLYESAMIDAKDYGILSIEEVDGLKKELTRLVPRLEAAQKKLTMELKLRGAAQNLQRLDSKAGRADTPQAPDSPQLGRDGTTRESISHAEEELASSQKKIEDLHTTIHQLLDRRAEVDRKLLRHTVAVLASQCEHSASHSAGGQRSLNDDDDDAVSTYEADEFDGIRDILGGRTIGKTSTRINGGKNHAQHEEQIRGIQDRLERFNNDLRGLITDAAGRRGVTVPPEPLANRSEDTTTNLEQGFERLDTSLKALEREHTESRNHVDGHSQKLAEYETTLNGLWESIQSDDSSRPHSSNDGSANVSRSPPLKVSFSLPAFNSHVQHIFDKAAAAKEQHNILLRQVQQQRELNGKSDAEKDRQIQDLQSNHDSVLSSHNQLQDELATVMAKHATSETEATHLRNELSKVEQEVEGLKTLAQTKTDEHQAISTQLVQVNAAKDKAHSDLQDLESEIVRLTTELTMAKAELEGAYGSRAERAKEAQAGEVEALKSRSASLEEELAAMTSEFQELTRESMELERERSHLDTLIDGLRERCETLEAQLSDEKVRWMGVKSPVNGAEVSQVREQTSMAVMRQEFKKMMRDARAEGVKLLRAEQEERRKLEAEVRRLRQTNTPLGKNANAGPTPIQQ